MKSIKDKIFTTIMGLSLLGSACEKTPINTLALKGGEKTEYYGEYNDQIVSVFKYSFPQSAKVHVVNTDGSRLFYEDDMDLGHGLDKFWINHDWTSPNALIEGYVKGRSPENDAVIERENTNFQKYIKWADNQIQKDKESFTN